ncbi:MAG: phenylacetate--CoA ligase family protein [Anaerolineales bacterium]
MELQALIQHLAQNAPGFAERLRKAGLDASQIRTLADLNVLPVIRKDDLVEIQAAHPPFGGFLACDVTSLRRIFQSPGPIYDPEPRRTDYWRWAPALEAAGFEAGDLVLNCFGYHLTPAGAMFEEGLYTLGCTVIPGGVGNQEQQARLIADLRINGYVGLPSYLKALIEKVESLGLTHSIEKAFFTAEPLPPSLRRWLHEHGVRVARQGYGTAECGNLGYECEAENGWHVPEDVWLQVCDLNTGQPLPPGEVGEIVVTLLNPYYALVRFGTGDLSSLSMEPCSCGRPSPRLMGWHGRVGDAVKVRGMFLHPHQLTEFLHRFPQIARGQALITRHEHRDSLTLRLVLQDKAVNREELAAQIVHSAREALKFSLEVEFVPAEALPSEAPLLRDERTWE